MMIPKFTSLPMIEHFSLNKPKAAVPTQIDAEKKPMEKPSLHSTHIEDISVAAQPSSNPRLSCDSSLTHPPRLIDLFLAQPHLAPLDCNQWIDQSNIGLVAQVVGEWDQGK